jgi:hypothetical protein
VNHWLIGLTTVLSSIATASAVGHLVWLAGLYRVLRDTPPEQRSKILDAYCAGQAAQPLNLRRRRTAARRT